VGFKFTYCQSDFKLIDQKAKNFVSDNLDFNETAVLLTKELNSDLNKVRSIYIWITHNIEYDVDQLKILKKYPNELNRITDVYQSKKGICQGYSELFKAMCGKIGLNCFVISGYTKELDGSISDETHAWNVVEIENNYFLIDLTWDAGYVIANQYVHFFRENHFLSASQEFIKTHMPFNPIWQLSNNPINDEAFANNHYDKFKREGEFSYLDSISLFVKSNKLERMQQEYRRLDMSLSENINNRIIKKHISRKLRYSQHYLAIEYYNSAIQKYNTFISHKNRFFRKPKIDIFILDDLLKTATNQAYQANELLLNFKEVDDEIQPYIKETKEFMSSFSVQLERENRFFNKYKRRWKPLRIFTFFHWN
jgi:hypothetical protein